MQPCARAKRSASFEEPASVSPALKVSTNGDPTKRCHGSAHVDPDDTDGDIARPENQWMIIRPTLVRMIGVVFRTVPAKLEEDMSADRVISGPIHVRRRRLQLLGHVLAA